MANIPKHVNHVYEMSSFYDASSNPQFVQVQVGQSKTVKLSSEREQVLLGCIVMPVGLDIHLLNNRRLKSIIWQPFIIGEDVSNIVSRIGPPNMTQIISFF
jgi:hypothetical protein